MQILFDWDPIKAELFETSGEASENGESIYCVSPYVATTHQSQFRSSLWLDTNVMLRTPATNIKPNIRALLTWAGERGMNINLDLAIWELTRSKPIGECLAKVEECTNALKVKFGLDIPQEMWMAQTQYRFDHKNMLDEYIDQQAQYLIIIKYFYHQDGKFEEKCERFASFIHAYLPFFRIIYLAGLLYLFAKQKGFLFEDKAKRKWQADMDRGTSSRHWSQAKNAASDLAITTFVTFFPLIPMTDILDIPYIATSDCGLVGFLSELGYGGIHIDEGPYRVGYGKAGYREESIARGCGVASIADRLSDQFSFNVKHTGDEKALRLKNLSEISDLILEKDFKISLVELKQHLEDRKAR